MTCWGSSTSGCASHYLTAVVLLLLGLCSGAVVKAECDGTGNRTMLLCTPEIAGIAVGGSVLLLSIVFFSICICCCCLRRNRKKKVFNLITNSDENPETVPMQVPLSFTNDTTFMDSKLLQTTSDEQVEIDTDKLPMEVGHTTFKDSSKPLYHPPVPRKSFSSHNLSELQNSTNKEQPAANPDTLSPGYVQMNSAGSIRASKSLGNLVSVTDEQEIYTDPDKIIEDVSLLNLANKSSPSKSPISLKPYQSCGDARSVSLLEGNIHHTSSRSASPEKHNSDYYVPSEVFVQDKEEQETIDSYYNKDAIESVRMAMSLSNAATLSVDSPALYVNIDGPPTPQHMIRVSPTATPIDKQQKDDYESIEDYIGSQNTASPPPKSNYYNIRNDLDRPTEDSYSDIPTAARRHISPDVEEDDQYVYMKSNTHPPLNVLEVDTSSKQRTQTSPTHSVSKIKPPYQNLDYEQKGELSSTLPAKPSNTSSKRLPAHQDLKVMTALSFPPKGNSSHASPQSNTDRVGDSQESEVEMYVNVTHNSDELYEDNTSASSLGDGGDMDLYVNVGQQTEDLYEAMS